MCFQFQYRKLIFGYFQIWFWIYHSPWFSGGVRDIDLCAFHSFVQVSDFIMHPSRLSEWRIQFMIFFLLKYMFALRFILSKTCHPFSFLEWKRKIWLLFKKCDGISIHNRNISKLLIGRPIRRMEIVLWCMLQIPSYFYKGKSSKLWYTWYNLCRQMRCPWPYHHA